MKSKFIQTMAFGILSLGCLVAISCVSSKNPHPDNFVKVVGSEFKTGDSTYRYIGANFWYGAILGSKGEGGNRQRLVAELDSLKAIGIDNLRILAGGDGNTRLPSHIEPTLQKSPGVYDDDLLEGLDFLLVELEKRNMKAVIYLNNAWEWSGGYSTYLEWAGEGKAVNPADSGYPAYMDYASRFVTSEKAKQLAAAHVKNIVSRVNSINGRPYSQSPAIMAWQIANEPRAFSKEKLPAFARWIHETAKLIKSIDTNHLVSIGSEGSWGCENSVEFWKEINSFPEIDYATIHIWPYNWGWAKAPAVQADIDATITNTNEYIDAHYRALGGSKPLVLEEFGFPRDSMNIASATPVSGRDEYYSHLIGELIENNRLAGLNFWGWGGFASPAHRTWHPGDDYTGDPAQEDQGLNSVFANDTTTINILKAGIAKLNAR